MVEMTDQQELEKPVDETAFKPPRPLAGPADTPRNAYLTIMTGDFVGRTYRLGPGRLLVGRADDSDIVINAEGVSRRHALLMCRGNGAVVLEDLGSTNGTLIDGKRQDIARLRGGERLQFGSDVVLKFEYRDAIEEQYATYLYESATQDHLTDAYNERFFRDQLKVEYAWHSRHDRPLTLIFIDIDHFKTINDEHGHLIGDAVLRDVVARCRDASRTEDVFARYGGEEFACLLRETPGETGTIIAERMRRSVCDRPFEYKTPKRECRVNVSISAGVAQLDKGYGKPDELIDEADRRLYRAKRKGRNRVESALL